LFYVVHFYVLDVAQGLPRTQFGLLETDLIWLALFVVMTGPCMPIWSGTLIGDPRSG